MCILVSLRLTTHVNTRLSILAPHVLSYLYVCVRVFIIFVIVAICYQSVLSHPLPTLPQPVFHSTRILIRHFHPNSTLQTDSHSDSSGRWPFGPIEGRRRNSLSYHISCLSLRCVFLSLSCTVVNLILFLLPFIRRAVGGKIYEKKRSNETKIQMRIVLSVRDSSHQQESFTLVCFAVLDPRRCIHFDRVMVGTNRFRFGGPSEPVAHLGVLFIASRSRAWKRALHIHFMAWLNSLTHHQPCDPPISPAVRAHTHTQTPPHCLSSQRSPYRS